MEVKIATNPTRWGSMDELVRVYNITVESGGNAKDVLYYFYPELIGNLKTNHKETDGSKLYCHLQKVICLARKKGLVTHYHGVTDDVRSRMYRLYNAGYSLSEISKATEVRLSTVREIVVENYTVVKQDAYPKKINKKQRHYNKLRRRERGG